jgi:hypothetical protein
LSGIRTCLAFLPDPLKNFFAMHHHILGRIHPEPALIAFDSQHRHGNVIADQ